MKILVTGANGQLGQTFLASSEASSRILFLDRSKLNVADPAAVAEVVQTFKPHFIFHFASLTRRLECANNPVLAHSVNVVGTKNIIEACKKVNATLVFTSTNEVFDGNRSNTYTEKSVTNPITTVGKTKLAAEELIQKELEKYYIVRTMWLYSKWSKNFLHSIVEVARKKRELSLVTDEIGSPTNSLDLMKAINDLIDTNAFGTYHIVNSGKASRKDFGAFALRQLGLQPKILSVTLSEFGDTEKPPRMSALSIKKLESRSIFMPTWEASLQSFLHDNYSS